jgi:DedD protein
MQTMAKQINADEESILKRNARHRLIGAVALTTFAVVTLPLIFDSQPPPTFNSDIELRIPGEPIAPPTNLIAESTNNSVIINTLPTTPAGVESKAETVASAVVLSPAKPAVTAQAEAEKNAPISKVDTPKTAVTPAVEVKSKTDSDQVKVEADKLKIDKPKSDSDKVKVGTDKAKADIAKAKVEADKAKTESKAKEIDKIAAAAHSGYVLQLGAYANPASAKNMEAKLVKLGFHAYSEKVGSNVRVRVGGYPTREAVEKARKKLAAQDLHADVIHLN